MTAILSEILSTKAVKKWARGSGVAETKTETDAEADIE